MKLTVLDWILVAIVFFFGILGATETVAALWCIFLVLYFIWSTLLTIRRDIYLSKGLKLYKDSNDSQS